VLFVLWEETAFHIHICLVGSKPSTIALLVVGLVLLVSGAVNEAYTKRSPIVPPRLFRVSS